MLLFTIFITLLIYDHQKSISNRTFLTNITMDKFNDTLLDPASSNNVPPRYVSFAEAQDFITTSMRVIRIIGELINVSINLLVNLFQMLKEVTTAYVSSVASYLSRSEDKRITRYKRSPTDEEYRDQYASQGTSIGSLFSKAFMAPFKLTFGLTRHIPIHAIYNVTRQILKPIGILTRNPVSRSIANTTMGVVDNVTALVWHYTKVSVLPKLDGLVTDLDKSETIPTGIMKYLKELQSLYHICRLFGIVWLRKIVGLEF